MNFKKVDTPAGLAMAPRRGEWWRQHAKRIAQGGLSAMLLMASIIHPGPQGPAVLGGKRVAKPNVTHSEVGRPVPRRSNPLVTGVAYVFRWDQWAPYFVATGGALNLQTLFIRSQSQSYTPSGGAALTMNAYHTTMSQNGLFSNPDMFNVQQSSFFVRSDIYVQDMARLVSDSIITFQIGNDIQYGTGHAFRFPAGGGSTGASSAIIQNGFQVVQNNYYFQLTEVDGYSPNATNPATGQPGTGYIFPSDMANNAGAAPGAAGYGSVSVGSSGAQGEVVTQMQKVSVKIDPTQVIDANANGVYTTSATGTGVTAFFYLQGEYARTVQG